MKTAFVGPDPAISQIIAVLFAVAFLGLLWWKGRPAWSTAKVQVFTLAAVLTTVLHVIALLGTWKAWMWFNRDVLGNYPELYEFSDPLDSYDSPSKLPKKKL